MSETAQRAAVVAEARSWIGTPYHNCADIKGRSGSIAACCWSGSLSIPDCVPPFDPRPYPADWHLHRERGTLSRLCLRRAAARSTRRSPANDGAALRPLLFPWRHRDQQLSRSPSSMPIIRRGACIEEEIARKRCCAMPARKPRFFSLLGGEEEAWAHRETRQVRDMSFLRTAQLSSRRSRRTIPACKFRRRSTRCRSRSSGASPRSRPMSSGTIISSHAAAAEQRRRRQGHLSAAVSGDDRLHLHRRRDHGAVRRADHRHRSDLARAVDLHAGGLGLVAVHRDDAADARGAI